MRSPRYCHQCGKKLGWKKEGSQRRLFCRSCKIFIYENPLPVAGVVCLNKKKEVLLIKRAIEPAKGKWALPSGFIELHEPPEKAALRELYEETGVRGKIIDLIGIYSRSGSFYKSLISVFYLATVIRGKPRITVETEDVGFFPLSKFKPLAFKTHRSAYKRFLQILKNLP